MEKTLSVSSFSRSNQSMLVLCCHTSFKPYTTRYDALEHHRFPGGECYRDLVARLESCIIDMEQQVAPVLVVSHVSVLQTLIAYFRNSPIDQCMSIEIPMHTVVKFEPSRGGGWKESRFPLLPDTEPTTIPMPPVMSESELSAMTNDLSSSSPIWGDHVTVRQG